MGWELDEEVVYLGFEDREDLERWTVHPRAHFVFNAYGHRIFICTGLFRRICGFMGLAYMYWAGASTL
jgi:hypothetical protein